MVSGDGNDLFVLIFVLKQ